MTMRPLIGLVLLLGVAPVFAQAVYRCPGPPIEYTDQITEKEAKARNCRTIDSAPITVVSPPKPRPVAGGPAASRPSGEGSKVDPAAQRARDSDARKILEAELQKEEAALAALQKDYNNGEPERKGEERNYQKYLDRVAEMKAAIERKEADVAAIRRELSKLSAAR